MLLRCEGVDLAAPEGELSTCNLLIDFERHVVYHATRFTADLAAVFHKIFCAERLDSE